MIPTKLFGKAKAAYADYIFPARFFGGLDYVNSSMQIKKSDYWKREHLIKYQTDELKRLLSFSYTNILYYKRLFVSNSINLRDIHSLSDLKSIPLLKRDDLNNNFNNLISKRASKNAVLSHSSGSTGIPVKFYLDHKTIAYRNSVYTRLLDMMDVKLTDKVTQFDAELFLKSENRRKLSLQSNMLNKVFLSSRVPTNTSFKHFVNVITSFKPKLLVGPSSMLFLLADYVKENKLSIQVDKVLNIQENIDARQRRFIEQTLNSEVFNFYSVNEQVCSAMECPAHNMHVYMCRCIVETVDKDGKGIHDKEGRIIATGLTNYLMPLIRYDVGDVGVITNKKCKCGRESLVLKSIKGRSSDVLRYKNKSIHASLLSVLLYNFKGFTEWQFIQDAEDSLVIKAVKNRYFTERDKRNVVQSFRSLTDKDLKIKLQFVNYIPRIGSNKKQLFISYINKEKKGYAH